MKKILIVEDEIAYLTLLSSTLSKNGYQICKATDGEKGLSMAKSEKPDLILLDIRIPKMDGMAVLTALRKTEIGKNMKVIMLTNLEPDGKILDAIVNDQPAYYFVKSDIKIEELLQKISELLD